MTKNRKEMWIRYKKEKSKISNIMIIGHFEEANNILFFK